MQAVLEKNGLKTVGLEGAARDAELKSFLSGNAWYHGAEVDNLTRQESWVFAGGFFAGFGQKSHCRTSKPRY